MFGFNKGKKYHHTSCEMMAEVINIGDFDLSSEIVSQVVGAYLFGMLNGLGQELKVKPTDIQGEMIKVANEKLDYTIDEAVEFSEFLINATDRKFHETIYMIIHRGIEGYFLYKEKKLDQLLTDIQEVVTVVEEAAD